MPLSEKTKNRLLAPLAISPIMKWGALPGLIGIPLIVLGFARKIMWLKVTGIVLVAPIIWVYAVIILVFLPIALFKKIRKT